MKITVLSSLYCFLMLTVSLNAQLIGSDADLIAFYPFDGNARNMVENTYHGIETNIQYVADRDGNPMSCCFLNGTNGFIRIPHTESLNFDARTESYSILFWVKSPDPLQGRRVLSKWNENNHTVPYPFSIQCGQNGFTANIDEINSSAVFLFKQDVWDDQWHHVAMVVNHENHELSLYVDNLYIGSNTYAFSGTTKNNVDIYIGLTPVLNWYFQGYIDDLYFYGRAINECEIEALYSGQFLKER